ncbi:hypothetical protein CW304_17715 [Bacillus sp. UFRGS-B20]|nr:hypothetical protein CW304_17715 [Bacillus sp. UFRGS-B20]
MTGGGTFSRAQLVVFEFKFFATGAGAGLLWSSWCFFWCCSMRLVHHVVSRVQVDRATYVRLSRFLIHEPFFLAQAGDAIGRLYLVKAL